MRRARTSRPPARVCRNRCKASGYAGGSRRRAVVATGLGHCAPCPDDEWPLSRGYVHIGQTRKELRGEDEDVTSRCVKWLEAQILDKRAWMDSLNISFDVEESSREGDENV